MRSLLLTLVAVGLAALVRAEKIPGQVHGDGPLAGVDLTMASADLLAFLESKDGRGAFGPATELVRVEVAAKTL